jgi:hypothetical protein
MARLHAIGGVTRVSLSKSDIQNYDATATGDTSSAAQRRNAAPCGLGKRPTFEIVVFFERADAATVASATSAGAVPTPTATPAAGATPAPSTTPAPGATSTPSGTSADASTTSQEGSKP